MKKAVGTILVLLVLAFAGGVAAIYSGFYNVAATEQHSAPVFWALSKTSQRSIASHARDVEPPDLSDPRLIERGLRHYQVHCVQCHGGPGQSPESFAMGMKPVPPSLVPTAREWDAREIFWTIKHGIKMSGMPGWEFHLPDEEMWAITAFVETLPELAPARYRELVRSAQPPSGHDTGLGPSGDPPFGDRDRGKRALSQYGCTSCHRIGGIVGPDVRVGPPLRRFAEQKYVAGVIPNSRENLVNWIRRPQEIDPLTAMPDMGVSEAAAWDMAAYLYDPD